MKHFRRLSYWSVVVVVVSVALLIVVISMFDTRVWWLDLPSQFRWHELLFFAVATLAALPFLFLRTSRRTAWAVAATALIGLLLTSVAVVRADSRWVGSPPRGGTSLDIVHFNLGERTGDWQNVLVWLRQQQADVIFLQEARPAFERELDASPLAKFVVFRNVRPDSRGTIALVVNPQVKLIEAHRDDDTFIQTLRQLVTLTIDKDGVRHTLLSVHMCRPTNATEFAKQSYEIEQLGRWFDAHPDGVAIGDCNCTAYSPRLTKVIHTRRLVAQTAGTWPTPLPSWFDIGIDALLVRLPASMDAHAGPDLGSDHRPLVATLRWP